MKADVAIIGAGPAGSMAGAILARRGRSVVCLERTHFPRFQIGESLLPRCNELLERAGLLDAELAKRYLVKHGATFQRGDETVRFRFADGMPGDYTSSLQVPRDDFDQALATRARALGADVRFGQQVEEVEVGADGVRVTATDADGGARTTVEARFVIDCSGYGRVLPRLFGIDRPATLGARSAYFTHVEGDRRPPGDLEGDIWVCVLPRAWIWIIPFSSGRTSVGVVAEQDVFDGTPGSDAEKLLALVRAEPSAAARLARAVPVLRTMKLQSWSTAVETMHGPRWAVTGNAGEFLDPVFSSGVCLALESAGLAAELADRFLGGEQIDWETQYGVVIRQATNVFRSFVEGWYDGGIPRAFFTEQRAPQIQRLITSVLAGYVRNPANALVRNPERMADLVHAIDSRAAGHAGSGARG